jgi:uncharacterized membrane protein
MFDSIKNRYNKISKKNRDKIGYFFAILLPRFFIALFFILTFTFAYFSLPFLPEKIATHWNFYGEADGFMDKELFAPFFPILTTIIFLLMYLLPKTDPLKENVKKFWPMYIIYISAIIGFFFNIQAFVLAYNLGYKINTISFMASSFIGLFFWTALLLFNAKRNYFIGIKTPWALSSDTNWEKTHLLGGKLFLLCAAICVIPMIFPEFGISLIIAPVIISTIIVATYSFIIREKKK